MEDSDSETTGSPLRERTIVVGEFAVSPSQLVTVRTKVKDVSSPSLLAGIVISGEVKEDSKV